ncbi:MAG: iron-sulfur cluster assembly scaffold protein [Pseudomonadota bacterium]
MAQSPLYDRDILRLAASLHRWPLDDSHPIQVEKRAPVCGSNIVISAALDTDSDNIRAIGMHVSACALGQASAAILATHAEGLDRKTFERQYGYCCDLLNGVAADRHNGWPEMVLLARAAPYPARHGAILLPYQALAAVFAGQSALDIAS